jgi:endonuclease-3
MLLSTGTRFTLAETGGYNGEAMARGDPAWLRACSGPLSARRMSAALTRLARERSGGRALAVSKAGRDGDAFAALVACLISLRTRDEVTDAVAPRLLAAAPDPRAMLRLSENRIARLIYPSGFYRTKARTLRAVARRLVDRHAGHVPRSLEALLELPGVGRKTANLVRIEGHGLPGICVDTHVHRISNRLGFVRTETPNQTELALRRKLPRRYWIGYNDLLVAFGQNVCRPLSPHCSRCPVAGPCQRVGVGRAR